MGQQVSDDITIDAPVDTVWSVITDIDAYPEWAEGVRGAEVLASNDDGSPSQARFRVDARVAEITYTLRYDYEDHDVRWELVEGESVSQLDGAYLLRPNGDSTEVQYTLEVDVDMPVPTFLKKRAARYILDQGLRGLKARAEARG